MRNSDSCFNAWRSARMAGVVVMFVVLGLVKAQAGVTVVVEKRNGGAFEFPKVAAPAKNDVAADAVFSLIAGQRDRNGADLSVLHDGRIPDGEDEPGSNFFFAAGTDGGRIRVDLGRQVEVRQISTYSWHPGSRGPQVYLLFASDGAGEAFDAEPDRGVDPTSCGWSRIAAVDTRPDAGEDEGGQFGVVISDDAGSLGRFRYLLFDISPTESRSPFGNTFYSEIDVVSVDGPELVAASNGVGERIVSSFATPDGRYRFEIDSTAAPDLAVWAEAELKPVVLEWYPKIVAMLPSDGFEAATDVLLRFRNDMGGIPASAGGGRVNMNAGWFRRELDREARGAVVHELVHVVQDYRRARRTNASAVRTPGWIVEGLPDYIRWFLYEPETRGAEITERNIDSARYNASYRISGNFLNWVVETHDKDLIRKLNAAAREGRYNDALWEEWTESKLEDLGVEWKRACEERLKDGALE